MTSHSILLQDRQSKLFPISSYLKYKIVNFIIASCNENKMVHSYYNGWGDCLTTCRDCFPGYSGLGGFDYCWPCSYTMKNNVTCLPCNNDEFCPTGILIK